MADLLRTPIRNAEVVADVDICVVGGGPAGLGAALAASRLGASVCLLERHGFLGGNFTAASVGAVCGLYVGDGRGSFDYVTRGIAEEVAESLKAAGKALGPMPFQGTAVLLYVPWAAKRLFDHLATAQEGITLFLHALVADAVADDGRVEAVIVATKRGPQAVRARAFVDASGDADLVTFAGGQTTMGDVRQYASMQFVLQHADTPDLTALPIAIKEHGAHLSRDGGALIPTFRPGEYIGAMTRVKAPNGSPLDATRLDHATYGEVEGRRLAEEAAEFVTTHVPGFEHAFLADTAPNLGVRETRRVVGDYTITCNDVSGPTRVRGRHRRRGLAAGVPHGGTVHSVRAPARGQLLPGAPPGAAPGGPRQRVGGGPVHLGRPRRAGLRAGDGAVDGARTGGRDRGRAEIAWRGRDRQPAAVAAGTGRLPRGGVRVNLAAVIEGHPDDAVALVSRHEPTTYGMLRQQVAELRGGFARMGVEPGDRVAVVAANNWFFAVTYLGVLGAGAVAVPLNPGSPAAELERELATIGAKVVIGGPASREALADAGVEHRLFAGDEQFESLFGGAPAPVVDRDADDLAVLMFTSGTSGSPKAAKLTHGNLLSNIEQVQRHPGRTIGPDDALLGVLPMFHIFGLNVVLGLGLAGGARVVLVERFDPMAALDTLQRHGITLVAGAPPMYTAWATMPGANPGAFATVRLATSGAAPLADEIGPAFEARFGLPIHQGYGLTEASPVVTSSLVDRPPRTGSIGVPLPGIEVRLVDEEGEDALVGDPGEIWVRGPNVFSGYWEDDEATAAALTDDGWLRTGDIAVADDDGWLYIVDRSKDLIIVSGFNVYPAEVEEALLEHPGIAQVAVVGNSHPYSGETVVAFVVADPGQAVEEDEVIEFCADRLARYKCPTKVNFVPSLPVGVAGKVLRRSLRSA